MKKIFFLFLLFASVAKAQYLNNRFVTTQNGLLNNASIFTVEFWVKTNDNRNNNIYWQRPYLFGNETNGDNSGDFGIVLNNGYIGMFNGISTLNTDQQFVSSIRINDNFFHHIAAVNNGQTINLFVDGNLAGSTVSGRALYTLSAPLTFGAASLDHQFNGNTSGNINFIAQAEFGQARISNIVRYSSNFIPEQTFQQDANVVATYQFGNTNYVYDNGNPNEPVTFNSSDAINDNAAKPATLFINDSTILNGKLYLGKKNWSLNNDILIRFFENGSNKVKYFKPEEIKGFQMGDSYYEPKYLGIETGIHSHFIKTMVKRLTPQDAKMALYLYVHNTSVKKPNGFMENKREEILFVQLPNSKDDKVYQFSNNKFVPKFENKVSAIVADKPELAAKIKNKNKDYWYAFITEQQHQIKVWWNIVNEYNQ